MLECRIMKGIIFPNQLFEHNPVLEHTNEVYLIEDSLFFGDKYNPMKFHKQKLVLHRASMKAYQHQLEQQGVTVTYVNYDPLKTIEDVIKDLHIQEVVCVDPVDFLLRKRLKRVFPTLEFLHSPLFINTQVDNEEYLKNGKLFMHEFYKYQRQRLNILMDNDGPVGGRLSFDDENRKKVPKSHYPEIPADPIVKDNTYIEEALSYVQENFPENYGSLETFSYGVTRPEALEVLSQFCKQRLHLFGDYEDAIVKDRVQLYHSMLSAYLNIGLLTPQEVVDTILSYAEEHNIPINNTEGIIRQIIGWREFIRLVYDNFGTELRNANEWRHTNPLPSSFYNATTGIEPIDTTITKTLTYAYVHHIERLMVLGNFFFLTKIEPNEVYQWFMELYIDAYDWVMVPNVYGMVLQTKKNLMTTKPYISGSNYVRKMSDYSKGSWSDIWDALYWNTIIENLEELKANGRMHFVTARAASFDAETKQQYEQIAKEFHQSL
jgi:deoxyribodipyrimidine photolyase-related protein